MELTKMIYKRAVEDTTLIGLLATYANAPAVFYQSAAPADDPNWGNVQYPRIDYTVDMQENPARNTSGVMLMNVWCDSEQGSSPEAVEAAVRNLFHCVFAQADDYPYCFGWVRSDVFDGKTDKEQNIHTFGITLVFDIIAYPEQLTTYPDPIKAMNEWTHTVLPNAKIIGRDTITGWFEPTKAVPAVYWRLAGQDFKEKHFTHTWLEVQIEGYVYAKNSGDRLHNLGKLNQAAGLLGHVTMEDTSPLFLRQFDCKPHMNYLTSGQIKVVANFGILQPQSHLRSADYTGEEVSDVAFGFTDNPEQPGEGS